MAQTGASGFAQEHKEVPLSAARRSELDQVPDLGEAYKRGTVSADEVRSYLFDCPSDTCDSDAEPGFEDATRHGVYHLDPTGETAPIMGAAMGSPKAVDGGLPERGDEDVTEDEGVTEDEDVADNEDEDVTEDGDQREGESQDDEPQAQVRDRSPEHPRPASMDSPRAPSVDTSYLYPEVGTPYFGRDIATRREFYDTRYVSPVGTLEDIGARLCDAEFELAPHQMFVRNFLSLQTPYNGALLYHGLGSGKTCSAIGVAEEMRDYMIQMGASQRIIIVASPNVQENFKLQLFDERKLKNVDGIWEMQSCTGSKFLREINPTGIKDVPRARVVAQINRIVSSAYLFLGYIEFANYIAKQAAPPADLPEAKRPAYTRERLRKTFASRLIIVDEIHNIRMSNENRDKRLASEMDRLVDNVPDMRLLFLSATPMYNSHREIIWLLNLLRRNDRREPIHIKDVFASDGTFVVDDMGEETGKQHLIDRATGYISFVRGDNPYTFPYRVWPREFSPERTFAKQPRPSIQLNGQAITRPVEHVDVYLTALGSEQRKAYSAIIERLERGEFGQPETMASGFTEMESFGYTLLQRPLESLNISYPFNDGESSVKDFVGKGGLDSVVTYVETVVPPQKYDFRYRPSAPHVFSRETLPAYSGKLAEITRCVMESSGIVLVYSQYIDGGLIPMALSLEELGFSRKGSGRNLFAEGQVSERTNLGYVMITGDRAVTPDPVKDLKAATDQKNADGSQVKVILISQAGSEGLDFRNIRQVHVLEPWYNMNRIEQIIGRGVRTCSHKDLPFSERNVQIFLHATVLDDRDSEAADVYVYRLAESKALQIGRVSRALKKGAIDCLLNLEQMGFSADRLDAEVEQRLSTGPIIRYRVGDKPFTPACDYMSTCEYTCADGGAIESDEVVDDSYGTAYANMNVDRIVQRIRALMKEEYVYSRDTMISRLHAERGWPVMQIDAALTKLVRDTGEHITDRYGRLGRLVNIGRFYFYQPIEITDARIPIEQRSTPVEVKRRSISFGTPDVDELPGDQTTDIKPVQVQIDECLGHLSGDKSDAQDPWAVALPAAVRYLRTLMDVDDGAVRDAVVGHYCDYMSIASIEDALNAQPSDDVAAYFGTLSFSVDTDLGNMTGIPLVDAEGVRRVLVKRGSDRWQLASPEDMYELEPVLLRYANAHSTPIDGGYEMEFPAYVGYIGPFTKTKELVFRTKKMTAKGNTGARCDQAKRTDTSYKILHSVFTDRTFTTKNADVPQSILCVVIEVMLRAFQRANRDAKTWFLSPGLASTIDIRKITTR